MTDTLSPTLPGHALPGALYASSWSPKGAARVWRRTSMSADSARRRLTRIVTPRGLLTEAVGWFDPDGALRILVCDFDSGLRLTARLTTRGLSATIGRTPPTRPSRPPGRPRKAAPPAPLPHAQTPCHAIGVAA